MTARVGPLVIGVLGGTQTLAWASSYYLPAVLGEPIAADLGVASPTVYGAFSLALLLAAAVGPRVGRLIDTRGATVVLAGTNVLFCAGLLLLACAQGPIGLIAAWLVLGLAMAAGLYETAFAALVQHDGAQARRGIVGITLIAGFASTVGWPLSAWLSQAIGWRGACCAWAALHLLVGLPLNLWLPRGRARAPAAATSPSTTPAPAVRPARYALPLGLMFATTWFVAAAVAAHLPQLLQHAGATAGVALAAGALIGPSQVAARLLEFTALRRVDPLTCGLIAAAAFPLGAALLLVAGAPAVIAFTVLFGAGNGMLTIARGVLPLRLFGAADYARWQGRLMLPARTAQAAAPFLCGVWLDREGGLALWALVAVALVGVGSLVHLRRLAAPSRAA